ncbi:hypothetical protein MTO96_008715 [Rhipicephalus appendiculatus]
MQSYRLMLEHHHEEAMKGYDAKTLLHGSALHDRGYGDGYTKGDAYSKNDGYSKSDATGYVGKTGVVRSGSGATDATANAYKTSTEKCILLNSDPKEKSKKGESLPSDLLDADIRGPLRIRFLKDDSRKDKVVDRITV